ncbi:MAG: leucyl aminopeptidase family protein, partial [Rhodospirillales bacterium]|nr:leucyl aminopeptidase family protein [Rhodospirillales bacterium]
MGAWLAATSFIGAPDSFALLPGPDGVIEHVLAGFGEDHQLWSWAGLANDLPRGVYRFDPESIAMIDGGAGLENAVFGWAVAAYRYDRYRNGKAEEFAVLEWPADVDRDRVQRLVEAVFLVRDLINTPANDLGPAELAEAAQDVAVKHGADFSLTIGKDLLEAGYPAIYAVGQGSPRLPRLADFRWGDRDAPLITLVGKGVCFDTGGLDMKTASGMKLMKKDMGGAAHVLGLASAVMAAGLPVQLRVLVPAVENSVSGTAFRPHDVISTRKGLKVEIANTDAEGRLILADALTEAVTESPRMLVDFATLTGAARVALGPDLPALFSNDDDLAAEFIRQGEIADDPLWHLPLFAPYRDWVRGKVADLNNAPDQPFAGAIAAALFLSEFVEPEVPWAHIDLMAWNVKTRPGRPEGGEAMGLRAAYGLIEAGCAG